MTKELLPGLGSGALREALQKWQRKYFSAGISHEMWPKAVEHGFEAGWLAALALSSPIEPVPEVEAWNEGYDAGFGAATLKHTNPEEFARRAEHTKEVVMRAVAKWEGVDAKPAQASSEICDILQALIEKSEKSMRCWMCSAWDMPGDERNEPHDKDCIYVRAKAALAPSRQGAGGK